MSKIKRYDLTRLEGAVREIEWELRGKDPDERTALMDALCNRTLSWPSDHAAETERLRAENEAMELVIREIAHAPEYDGSLCPDSDDCPNCCAQKAIKELEFTRDAR